MLTTTVSFVCTRLLLYTYITKYILRVYADDTWSAISKEHNNNNNITTITRVRALLPRSLSYTHK